MEILKRSLLSNSAFYLARGTGLALILAHRKSVDFDFFSKEAFFPTKLIEQLRNQFQEDQIFLIEMKEDTLIVILKKVQTSFFYYNYPLLKSIISEDGLDIASIEDISTMKVISIVQRGLKKDFIDLYAILKKTNYSLNEIFFLCKKKYGSAFSESIALKALTYFKDAEEKKVPERMEHKFLWDEIKKELITLTSKYFHQQINS